jgi:hypothetical protein
MVALGMLQTPAVRRWLGGVEPAWTMLDQASFHALRDPPAPRGAAISLASNLAPEEIGQSAVTRNALILLHEASVSPGLKLTATGNLSRHVVAEMCDLFTWPGFDKAEAFRFSKVVNEPDFLPLFFVRHLVEGVGLLKASRGYLKTTPTGERALESPSRDALQALLFHIAFWRTDLSYLSRGNLGNWPQRDAGIVLWSLSVSANDWTSPERLARLCTIPINGVLDQQYDKAKYAIEGIILRPLNAFGLLEHRADPIPDQPYSKAHFYRKTPLFDRFLNFDVTIEVNGNIRH